MSVKADKKPYKNVIVEREHVASITEIDNAQPRKPLARIIQLPLKRAA